MPPDAADADAELDRLIQRVGGGDIRVALRQLRQENSSYRKRHAHDADLLTELQRRLGGASSDVDANVAQLVRENRDLQRQLDDLRQQLPPTDAVVLAGDAAKTYMALGALQLTPEQIKTALAERDTLKSQIASHQRRATLDDAANLLKWKAPVLRTLAEANGWHVEIKDVQVPSAEDSSKLTVVREAHVRPASDDKAVPKPLRQVVQEQFADFLPALTAAQSSGGTGGAASAPAQGVPYVPQPSGGGQPAPKDVVGNFIAQSQKNREATGSPLFPARPATGAASTT